MVGRIIELLKGSFWIIDANKLSELELDFLKEFFDIKIDYVINDMTFEEKSFLILRKKSKFISNSLFN